MDRLILVTGGTGYVGTVLVPLLAQHYKVRTLDTQHFGNALQGLERVEAVKGDIRHWPTVSKAMEGVTDVVHLAGIVTDALVDMNPKYAKEVNNTALDLLCWAAYKAGVERFIYASSSSVYGSQTRDAAEDTVCRPETEYARTKLVGERIMGYWCERFGLGAVSLRSATCCGPAPRMRLDTIVNVFCRQAYWDRRITVHGGAQWRSNVHVADAAECYRRLLSAPVSLVMGQSYNLTQANHTALELAELVRLATGAEIWIDASQQDSRHYRIDATKISQALGWVPPRSIEDAVQDNLAWFRNGRIANPDDPIYYNTLRMAEIVK